MKQKYFFAFLVIAAIVANFIGVLKDDFWLKKSGEFLFILPLLGYYLRDLPIKNLNFLAFLICVVAANGMAFLQDSWYFNHIILGLWLASYIFLVREAIKNTEYERGSRFMSLYFMVVVAIYTYLLFLHIMEIERSLSDGLMFSLYILYYLNILIFAITALVYYLNSFSRKSVFFMCLTLSFIFSDVFRDMEVFYFRDLSVELVGSLIRFAALKLVFLFFVTKEKKLRLLHLV
ncbi:hypothetical protein [Salinimicrobium flavum]|uniref:YhhN-like protein n=1 Tax=Salinimicrobium flavum TaxID=1737065 RepID=A0ABW5J1Y7_9FLAO